MKIKMLVLLCGITALLALPVSGAEAQLGPVRLTVNKIQTPEMHRFTERSYQYDEFGD